MRREDGREDQDRRAVPQLRAVRSAQHPQARADPVRGAAQSRAASPRRPRRTSKRSRPSRCSTTRTALVLAHRARVRRSTNGCWASSRAPGSSIRARCRGRPRSSISAPTARRSTTGRSSSDLGKSERDYVLKPSGFSELAWGSRGVKVANDLTKDEWREALREAQASFDKTPYILQRFHKGKRVRVPYLDASSGEIEEMDGRVRLCPYYFVDGDDDAAGRHPCDRRAGRQAPHPRDERRDHGLVPGRGRRLLSTIPARDPRRRRRSARRHRILPSVGGRRCDVVYAFAPRVAGGRDALRGRATTPGDHAAVLPVDGRAARRSAQLTKARAALDDPGQEHRVPRRAGGGRGRARRRDRDPRPWAASAHTLERWVAYVLGTIAISAGWLLVHTLYTFRYAHLFWYDDDGDGERAAASSFPGTDEPVGLGFRLLLVLLGTSFAVSDPQVTETRVRREVIAHSIISFAYNSVIIGMVINLFAGIFSRRRRQITRRGLTRSGAGHSAWCQLSASRHETSMLVGSVLTLVRPCGATRIAGASGRSMSSCWPCVRVRRAGGRARPRRRRRGGR